MSINSGNIPRNISAPSRHQVIKRARFSLLEERDEMRTNWVLTAAVVAMSVTAAVGSANATHQPSKGGTMSVTYTGCVETVNHGAAFLLTKVDSGSTDSMHAAKTMEHHDDMAMKHDDMAMKSDAAKPMQQEHTAMADEKMDAMPSKSFALAGSTNLSRLVGKKVSVTGSLSDGSMGTMRQVVSTLTVKTLKVVAKSCS